jgi:hypothetical protein
MQKIAVNTIHGGFSLSETALALLGDLKGVSKDDIKLYDIRRDDPSLIKVVESYGELANGRYSYIKIVEIPDDVEWIIQDYDGVEWVAEKHRTWF